MEEYPLFQAGGGGSTPTPPLHFRIMRVSHRVAKTWIEAWHYSHRIPTGKNISFGLWDGDALYAVIVYGIGVNPYQAQFLGVNHVLEIKRLARSEPKRDYHLSRFIAITAKMLRKDRQFDAIVAFADPEYGHEGIVYKAAGFIQEGTSTAEWHCSEKDGTRRHRRFAFRYARRNNVSVAAARDALGLERTQCPPKLRWVKRFQTEGA